MRSGPEGRGGDTGRFWTARWGWPQATTIAVCVVGIGMVIQAWKPRVVMELPSWPWNWVGIFGASAVLVALRRVAPRNVVVAGLGGLHMSVVSVLALALISAPGAVWPQGQQSPGWAWRLGFDHVFTSLGFAGAMLLLLANLSLALGRPMPLAAGVTWRFVAVHGGLLVAIGAACASSADLVRARLTLREGDTFSNRAVSGHRPMRLPFEVRLLDFRLESYPPTLVLWSDKGAKASVGSEFLSAGKRERLGDLVVLVERTVAHASVVNGEAVPDEREGAGPAAEITVFDASGKTKQAGGWVHAATPFGGELVVKVGTSGVVWMDTPKPRLFESSIEIREGGLAAVRAATLRVNQPVHAAGWTLFQTGYDEALGAASRVSVIEAVRDPGYPVVVAGLVLLCVGSLWFFWDIAKLLSRSGDGEETQ